MLPCMSPSVVHLSPTPVPSRADCNRHAGVGRCTRYVPYRADHASAAQCQKKPICVRFPAVPCCVLLSAGNLTAFLVFRTSCDDTCSDSSTSAFNVSDIARAILVVRTPLLSPTNHTMPSCRTFRRVSAGAGPPVVLPRGHRWFDRAHPHHCTSRQGAPPVLQHSTGDHRGKRRTYGKVTHTHTPCTQVSLGYAMLLKYVYV
jgi:hypothetical protein